jgi:hypothetical protein
VAGNGELGVLGIFLAIAVAVYTVSWTIAGPPGAVPATVGETGATDIETPATDRVAP